MFSTPDLLVVAKRLPALGWLYVLALTLGLCSIVLTAQDQPHSLIPLAAGIIITCSSRGPFAEKWAPICFLTLVPVIITVALLLIVKKW